MGLLSYILAKQNSTVLLLFTFHGVFICVLQAGLAALSVLFSSESLYVIVVNSGQDKRDRSIQRYVTLIQSKVSHSKKINIL